MTFRILLVAALPLAFASACRSEGAPDTGEEPEALIEDGAAAEVEGAFRGGLESTAQSDLLFLDGRELFVVVNVVQASGSAARLDVSVRPGLGRWLVGTGHAEVDSDGVGTVFAGVSDGYGLSCDLTGEWSASEGLMDADLTCVDYDGVPGAYTVVAGRF